MPIISGSAQGVTYPKVSRANFTWSPDPPAASKNSKRGQRDNNLCGCRAGLHLLSPGVAASKHPTWVLISSAFALRPIHPAHFGSLDSPPGLFLIIQTSQASHP